MDLMLWLPVGVSLIGFVVLFSMKKSMEERVALAIENEDSMEGEEISPKPVIWWIGGAVIWGVISIFWVIWSFYRLSG